MNPSAQSTGFWRGTRPRSIAPWTSTLRDQYRHVIEDLAQAAGHTEAEVAEAVVSLAMAAADGGETGRADHVGTYLLAEGRDQLETKLGYRPSPLVRLRRWPFRHPGLTYLGSIAGLTGVLLFWLLAYVRAGGADWPGLLVTGLLVLVPSLTIAVSLTNLTITTLTSPRLLPKLDFRAGVPPDFRTMVVVPTLLTSTAEVDALLRQLELHYLRNTDPNVGFALLSDWADAPAQQMPGDQELVAAAEQGVRALNQRYGSHDSRPFFLFHRERRWNPGEGVWMGWERKRGKLEEFNRLILGRGETTYTTQVGDLDVLPAIRYVITLDSDTTLPRGSAASLVGTLSHPLNRAQFDPETGKVVAGYTILQPRTEVEPMSANRSLFTRIYAGDRGLDLYTHATSDIYQDLFHEGIYVGKGIYDVNAFERSLNGRVPENTLLSHDLFEGLQGRAGLVTDIVLYEDYPPGYMVNARRVHRWVRGDWQLLPWLLPKVPAAHEGRIANDLGVIDRWQILDNLRRSLLYPALLTLFAAGWTWLPGSPWVWTLISLLALAVPLLAGLIPDFVRNLRDVSPFYTFVRTARRQTLHWLLSVTFLPYEALIALDAIITTLVRVLFSRRHLLQWTTAAHTVQLLGNGSNGAVQDWRGMFGSLVLVTAIGLLVAVVQPMALWAAVPFLVLWLLSPQIAHWISRPIVRSQAPLTEAQQQQLHRLARRTWLYFEQFIGPEDRWLAPDHFQESPRGLVAHRTSPTNLGLTLLSTLAAYDLGYLGMQDLAVRLSNMFRTFDELQQYRGHFLNWYDTRTLEPLPARYVSTVDSGNLAACLVALRQGCLSINQRAVLRRRRWQGLLDTLDIVNEVVTNLVPAAPEATKPLEAKLGEIRLQILVGREGGTDQVALLDRLIGESRSDLDQLLMALIESDVASLDVAGLRALRLWFERIRYQLSDMQRELQTLIPWALALNQAPALLTQDHGANNPAWEAVRDALPISPPLGKIPEICAAGRARLTNCRHIWPRCPVPTGK